MTLDFFSFDWHVTFVVESATTDRRVELDLRLVVAPHHGGEGNLLLAFGLLAVLSSDRVYRVFKVDIGAVLPGAEKLSFFYFKIYVHCT